jgi:hypothetical protein
MQICGIEVMPVDPKDLEEYERAMDEAIPQIVAEVQERQRLAQEARVRIILHRAYQTVKPLIEKERAAERITGELLNTILY